MHEHIDLVTPFGQLKNGNGKGIQSFVFDIRPDFVGSYEYGWTYRYSQINFYLVNF